jgi:hypothetical protein
MPDEQNGNENPVSEAERLGAEYQPPNPAATVANLKAKRDAARTALQANGAVEEMTRNARENLFKPLNGDITSLITYAASSGKAANEVATLKSKARDVKRRPYQTDRPEQRRRRRDKHLGRQSILPQQRRQLHRVHRTLRSAWHHDRRGVLQSFDAPRQTRRPARRQQRGHQRRIRFKHDRRAIQPTSLHRRRLPLKRLHGGKGLYQIKIQNHRTALQKHCQNALRNAVTPTQ